MASLRSGALLLLLCLAAFHCHGALGASAAPVQHRHSSARVTASSQPTEIQIGLIKAFLQSLWRYAGNKQFMRLILRGNLAGQMLGALRRTNAVTLLLPSPEACSKRLGDYTSYARSNTSLQLIMGFHIIMGKQMAYSDILAAPRVAKVRCEINGLPLSE